MLIMLVVGLALSKALRECCRTPVPPADAPDPIANATVAPEENRKRIVTNKEKLISILLRPLAAVQRVSIALFQTSSFNLR